MSEIQRAIEDFLTGVGYTGKASAVTGVVIGPRVITVRYLKENDAGDYYWDEEIQGVAEDTHVVGYYWDE